MNPLASMSFTDWLLSLAAFAIVCVVAHYADRRARRAKRTPDSFLGARIVAHRLTPRETEKRKCEKHRFVFSHVGSVQRDHPPGRFVWAVYQCSTCGHRIRFAMHRAPGSKRKGPNYDQA